MENEEWVSVQDRLPKIVKRWGGRDGKLYGGSNPVLAYSGEKFMTVAECYEGGLWDSLEGSKLENVTHWRALPCPPETKE